MKRLLKTKITPFRIFALLLTLACLFFITAFKLSPAFSLFYTLKVAPFFRVPLSFISSFFPFSLFESLLLIVSALSVIAVFSGIRLLFFKAIGKSVTSYFEAYIKIILSFLFFIFVSYSLTFAPTYSRTPLRETLNMEKVEMSEENVVASLDAVAKELNALTEEIQFTQGNPTRIPMTFDEMVLEVKESAERATKKYPIYQKRVFPAKRIAFSTPLAYTGISGIYGFFTGEANINTAFSDYSLPFTVAHEYSHQLGIGSEKEAEFSALLICLESNNPYVRYSAYSQVAITLSNLLYEMNEEAFFSSFGKLPSFLITDIYLSSQSYREYSKTALDEVASKINDTYLSISGDEGVVSYSLSAELYVSYFSGR